MRNPTLETVAVLMLAAGAATASESTAWTQQIGGTGPEIPFAVAGAPDGAAVAGTFDLRLTLGCESLNARRKADAFVARFDRDGRPAWARALGGRAGDQARGVAIGADGGVVATGYFTDRLDLFDGQAPLVSTGGADVFLLRFDNAGRLTWARSWGGANADTGLALAGAPDGGVWVTGGHQAAARFGDHEPRTAGGRDAFLMRVSAAGNVSAFATLGGPRDDEGRGVAVGASGHAYWLGRFKGTATAGSRTIAASEPGAHGVFVARVAPSGRLAWVRGLEAEHAAGIAVGPGGHVYVAGAFRGVMNLKDIGGPELTSAGVLDGFVLRLNSKGRVVWARSFGGSATDLPMALAVAEDGRVLLSGYFQGQSDFDPGQGLELRSSVDHTNADAFVLTLGTDGSFRDVRAIGGDGVEQGLALSAAEGGNVYLAGLFNDRLSTHGAEFTSRGKTDAFLMRLPDAADDAGPRSTTPARRR